MISQYEEKDQVIVMNCESQMLNSNQFGKSAEKSLSCVPQKKTTTRCFLCPVMISHLCDRVAHATIVTYMTGANALKE